MKYLLILIVASTFATISFSQDIYIPFIGQNKYWIYGQQDNWEPAPNTIGGFIFSFGTDTIINGIKYSKLIQYGLDGEHSCPNRPCFTPYFPYQINTNFQKAFAYLREDTVSKRVYCLPAIDFDKYCDTTEHVLFDFDQKVGDTLTRCNLLIHSGWPISEHYFIIDSINTEFIYDKHRKVSYFEGFIYGGLPYIRNLRQVEGIGIENNLGFYVDNTASFVSFCEGTLEQCNIISSIKEIQDTRFNKVKIFPNPAATVIQIETRFDISNVEFIDQNGKVVIKSSEKEINIANLQSGLYFVRCQTKKNEMFYTKFVKI